MHLHVRSQGLVPHIEPKKQPPRATKVPSLPCRLLTFIHKSTLHVQSLCCFVVDGDMDIQICYAPLTSKSLRLVNQCRAQPVSLELLGNTNIAQICPCMAGFIYPRPLSSQFIW